MCGTARARDDESARYGKDSEAWRVQHGSRMLDRKV